MHMDLSEIRKDYSREQLDVNSIHPDPLQQFTHWLQQAIEAGNPEPTAMNLATVNEQGQPACRMVLLKGVEQGCFHFFTNYESRKSRDLQAHPQAALCFWWPELERQVRVEGAVQKLSQEASYAYYRNRPLPSRLGAWASPQSQVIPSREALEALYKDTENRFEATEEVPLPPHWGGFQLRPHTLEFWQGRPSRLHDRIRYRQENGAWIRERLAP
ncbi:MAG: pyridoxamine 5'-phosphate oxidase [Bacteroidetes bacterium]|nr:pyridoxamine 5'-phosphate oxidase [Bacteroidota bacterium]